MRPTTDRRELLKVMAVLLGSSVSPSCTRAILSGGDLTGAPDDARFDGPDAAKIERIADLIVPRTDTPGAVEAGVPGFIRNIVSEWYTPEERERFMRGLAAVDDVSRRQVGRNFLEASAPEQTAVLVALEESAVNAAEPAGPRDTPFFSMIKELTVLGYYTSEVGSREELLYRPVPGTYRGDALFDDNARQLAL